MKKHAKNVAQKKRKKLQRKPVVTPKGAQKSEVLDREKKMETTLPEQVADQKKSPESPSLAVEPVAPLTPTVNASPVVVLPQAVEPKAEVVSAAPTADIPKSSAKEKPAKSELEVSVVLSNFRVPHQDQKAIDLCLMHCKDLKPEKIFFNGDIIDYYHRSDIDRNPLRIFSEKEKQAITREIETEIRGEEDKQQEALNAEFGYRSDDEENDGTETDTESGGERIPKRLVKRKTAEQIAKVVKKQILYRAFKREIEELFSMFRKFRETHPDAEFVWIFGCQEFYLGKYLEKNFPSLLDDLNKFCRENRIRPVNNGTRNNVETYAGLVIGHWFRGSLNSVSGFIAHQLLDDEGVSLIQGHTNRGGWACRTVEGLRDLSAFENFSLCKRPVGKNWQLGYSVVYRERGKKRFAVYQVPIANYGFFFGDVEYRLDKDKIGSWEFAVTLSDIHLRWQDKEIKKLAFAFLKEKQPDVIFINGDLNDFQDISRFSNTPLDVLTDDDAANLKNLVLESDQRNIGGKFIKSRLQREIDAIYDYLKELREICPKARIVWVYGNHEHRLQMYIQTNAPHLTGLRRAEDKEETLSLASLTRAKELGIETVYSGLIESYTTYGDLLVGHFYKVCNKSVYTARNLLRMYRRSLVQPHVHRLGAHYHTDINGKMFVAVEMGCQCRRDMPYLLTANWQHGFVVVHKKKNSQRFYLQPIHIVEGAFLFGGKRYGRKSKTEPEKEKPVRKDGIASTGSADNSDGNDSNEATETTASLVLAEAPKDAADSIKEKTS